MLTALFLALLAVAPTTQSTKPAAPATTRVATPVRRTVAEAKRVHDTAIAKANEQYLQAQIAATRAYVADLNSAVATAVRAENLEQANQAKAARDAATRELDLLNARLK